MYESLKQIDMIPHLCIETLFQDKNGHVLMTCPEILKYWTCGIDFIEK